MKEQQQKALKLVYSRMQQQASGAAKHMDHLMAVTMNVLLYWPTANEGILEVTFEDTVTAAILHDIMEDTLTSYEELKTLFGQSVADMVQALTKPVGSRSVVHAAYYEQLAKFPAFIFLKLMDRLANVERSVKTGPEKKLKMYKSEYPAFRAALYERTPEALRYLWEPLDQLIGVSHAE
jgi:(p)ppGpp synthase/HD superfamily hydrolase